MLEKDKDSLLRTMSPVFLFAVLLSFSQDVSMLCTFPSYIQSPKTEDGILPWTTKTLWSNLRDNAKWREQSKIYVEGSNMWRSLEEYEISCDSKKRRASESGFTKTKCAMRKSYYNRTCIQNQTRNAFRVVEIQPSGTKFMCMMFLKRSSSVIQVMQGAIWERNVPQLCDESEMVLEEWPWIASWNEMPSPCPISGGFTFRTKSRLTNQDLCEGDWRMSRLEVECINGDGMKFIAPKGSKCNPFSSVDDTTQLYCWAGWTYGHFTYMIGSADGEQPQFCIRFPRQKKGTFVVFIYFSVICPLQDDGLPPSGINYYELTVQRRDPTQCEDEHIGECAELKESGMCERPRDKYVLHCPKSCGHCDYGQNGVVEPSCQFYPIIHGHWKLYGVQRNADVKINSSVVDISDFGTFQCLSQNPDGHYYKTVSIFENGCDKRYTCLDLKRRNRNILQFRVGKSFRSEHSFSDMCEFHDDRIPLLDKYRSSAQKYLIYTGALWRNYCGIQGTKKFNGTFRNQPCLGTMSDTNPLTCRTEGVLTIRGINCPAIKRPLKFHCLDYITKEGIFDDFLITRSMDGRNHFNCWVNSSFSEMAYEWPQKIIYEMVTPQCKMFSEVLIPQERKAESELYIMGVEPEICIPQTQDPPLKRNLSTTTTTNVPYRTISYLPGDDEMSENSNQAYVEHPSNTCRGTSCVTFYLALFCYFLGRCVVSVFSESVDYKR